VRYCWGHPATSVAPVAWLFVALSIRENKPNKQNASDPHSNKEANTDQVIDVLWDFIHNASSLIICIQP
ncbi:hypothetical protein SJ593_28230, partial [Citrobacter freundii]|uniref:hypothetical protein n=1 Tax=Citrobacter freundii TaxID=546 RepID=UPI0029D74371